MVAEDIGLGRRRGVGLDLGVGVGLGVALGAAVGVGVGLGVPVGVGPPVLPSARMSQLPTRPADSIVIAPLRSLIFAVAETQERLGRVGAVSSNAAGN